MAVFILNDGVVTGADATGGLMDGSIEEIDGRFQVNIEMKIPAGTTLVTGVVVASDTTVQSISTNLPLNFYNGVAHLIETPTGPINVMIRRLRGLS